MHANKPVGLFFGNYDNGIIVANLCNLFSGTVAGKPAAKCKAVAPRCVHLLCPDDGAVVYEPISNDYLDYCRRLYGFAPRVFWPAVESGGAEQPLSLVNSVLGDAELLRRIEIEGREKGWRINPFISHPGVNDLGRRVNLRVAGMSENHVRFGRASELNDKAVFQIICRAIGIPVPDSIHAVGRGAVSSAAERIYGERGCVRLRRARAAGGLGNCRLTPAVIAEANCHSVTEYLERNFLSDDSAVSDTVLVEPDLDVCCSPSTLLYLENGAAQVVADTLQVLNRNDAFVGSVIPSGLDRDLRDRLDALSMRYAEAVYRMGGAGYFNIDWGILADGGLIAFESNYRYGGNNHVVALRHRLYSGESYSVFTMSNDALAVPSAVTFDDALALITRSGLRWDERRRDGIVITIPPHRGSMGYVALAESAERVRELAQAMEPSVQ